MPARSEQPQRNHLDEYLEQVHAAHYFAAAIYAGVSTPAMQAQAQAFIREGSPPRRYFAGELVADGGAR